MFPDSVHQMQVSTDLFKWPHKRYLSVQGMDHKGIKILEGSFGQIVGTYTHSSRFNGKSNSTFLKVTFIMRECLQQFELWVNIHSITQFYFLILELNKVTIEKLSWNFPPRLNLCPLLQALLNVAIFPISSANAFHFRIQPFRPKSIFESALFQCTFVHPRTHFVSSIGQIA